MMVVTKFGGSSLATASQFTKVKNIIERDTMRKIVIVSAPGKSEKIDTKVTDLLYLLYAHLKYKVDYHPIFNQIRARFEEIKKGLNLKCDLEEEFNKIESLFPNISEPYLISRGEYLNALLMAEYLGFTFVDAKDIIYFDYNGSINDAKITKAVNEIYELNNKHKNFLGLVIPGFYGAYPNKDIKLFTRGGSDITGSLIAKAINAVRYENWTDVNGILMADPNIIDNPLMIKEITYDELRELSYMGASVLHEDTIFPIQDLNIPIYILNTNAPTESGTIISNQITDNSHIITGVAGKKGFKSITIVKQRSSNKLAVIKNVLEIFTNFNVNIEHLPTSIDSFSVIVENNLIDKCIYEIINEIKNLNDVVSVNIDDDIALVAVVGRNMVTKPGISGKIFAIFGEEGINIKMIAQGSKEINIIVGISNQDLEKSIVAIYNKMVKNIV